MTGDTSVRSALFLALDFVPDSHPIQHAAISFELRAVVDFVERLRQPGIFQVRARNRIDHRQPVDDPVRHRLAVRLGDAPLRDGRDLCVALGAVKKVRLTLDDTMTEKVAESGAAVHDVDAVLPERSIEVEEPLFDALQHQDRGERAARVTYEVRCRRRRPLTRLEILESVALLPEDRPVADESGRHPRDSRLRAERLEIRVENRDDPIGREDRLLRRRHRRREKERARQSGQQRAHVQRISVNFVKPTTSSPCHGQTNEALRGAACARTRT